MFGINSTLPFLDMFLYVALLLIYSSLLLLFFCSLTHYKLKKWIENYEDEQIKQLDEEDFKRCKEVIRKTYNLLMLGLIMYIFVFIIQ